MMMARQFESGFFLVERCRRELPSLAGCFRPGSAMGAAIVELVEAAARVDALLCAETNPGHGPGDGPSARRAGDA